MAMPLQKKLKLKNILIILENQILESCPYSVNILPSRKTINSVMNKNLYHVDGSQ